MTIYLDENMPPNLAKALDILQESLNNRNNTEIKVVSTIEAFGRGAKDEEWIPQAGMEEAVVITQDYNINRRKHQRELCEQFNIGMIYFRPPSKALFGYLSLVQLIIRHWEAIIKVAVKKTRPFAYKIMSRGKNLEEI